MPETFFSKFPKISYSNTNIIDITRRCGIVDSSYSSPFLYSPVDITNQVRSDQLADNLYSDPYLDWQLYLSNKIIDPYYQWYLSSSELEYYIINKYGSEENVNNTKHYRVNYQNNAEDKLSVDEYATIGINEYKYWASVVHGNSIAYYTRAELDWTTSTNAIIRYTLSDSFGLSIGDILNIKITDLSYGTGEIVSIQGQNVFVKNVSGDCYEHDEILLNQSSYAYIDPVTLDMTQETIPDGLMFINESIPRAIYNINVIDWTIPLTEAKYWEPVSYYQYEVDNNEYNRSIRILSPTYLTQFISDTKKALNG